MYPVLLNGEKPQFPPTDWALEEPNGLLALGGNLEPETILNAYQRGIFPWFSEQDPILWWSPSPRMALIPSELHIGKSLKKLAKKCPFQITVDCSFSEVITKCSTAPRAGQDGTWITPEMEDAYNRLHELGYAHSVEAKVENKLVGGLYGIAIGGVFFGESMFSDISGASKIAFASLCLQLQKWGFELIDCQVHTDYLASFGAKELTRNEFEQRLARAVSCPSLMDWQERWSLGVCGFDGSK